MTAIIFGANGQDGFYLTGALTGKGYEVTGVSRSGGFITADISDFEAVKHLVNTYRPHYIFHLAANSTTAHEALFDNHKAISTGTVNILEAVKQVSPVTKVFLSGSGLQFANNNVPIKETDPFDASSAYAVARIHSVYAARYYRKLGIKVYVGYLFNHESPRRTERHVSKMIAGAVKRIAEGSSEIIEIGDLNVRKEWAFAGDIVRAVICLVEQDAVFEAVISCGAGYTIKDYVQKCFEYAGKDWKQYVKEKDSFTPQYRSLVGDPSTIFSLGWKPEYDLNDLVKMMLSE